jgi:uncharacterized protein YjiS (DUF1127 family)
MRPCYFDFEHQTSRRAAAIAMARPVARHRLPPSQRGRPAGLLSAALSLVRLWRRRSRERRQLGSLDARMLRDIGVTPSEAARECDKPFWRA